MWTDLPVKSISSRIGVFVDHSAGTLSFYSVSDTMSLIQTVQTTFTQTLYPGFAFGSESSVKLCWLISLHIIIIIIIIIIKMTIQFKWLHFQ